MTYTVGSLFSGIGGIDLAAHWAGFETAWFVEREPFCQQILHKHWPGVPVHSDVFDCHDLPHVDVIVGGFPCQPFSVAGNRKGADDERYLLPEMLRIISEVKPYAVLFENVPGFPSLNDGAEFKYLLRTLAEMGLNAEWGHLRASDCGAPHQRERWFCVAYTQSGHDAGIARTMGHSAKEARKQDVRPVLSGSGSDVADAAGIRRERHTTRQGQNRLQQGRASQLAGGNQTQLVNASRTGREERNLAPVASGTRHATGRHYAQLVNSQRGGRRGDARRGAGAQLANGYTRAGRSTQPRICGTTDGLPGWLDFAGWPASPGQDQYPYEPPRVTTSKLPNRAARLKALGNAVVPQQVYPLLQGIHDWLSAQETVEAEAS